MKGGRRAAGKEEESPLWHAWYQEEFRPRQPKKSARKSSQQEEGVLVTASHREKTEA